MAGEIAELTSTIMYSIKGRVIMCTIIILIICFFANYRYLIKRWNNLPTRCPHFARQHDLSGIAWPKFQRPDFLKDSVSLEIKTTEAQQKTLELLVEQFERVMVSLRLQDQWFLTAGTLLGSLQHHDFIPWDDDADLMLHVRHRPRVQAALRNLAPTYGTYNQGFLDKLYFHPLPENASLDANSSWSRQLSNRPWSWPFIDISYYEESGYNLGQGYKEHKHQFRLSDLYPITCRPFGKHWYPTPGRPISFLKSYYRTPKQVCSSHSWSHIREKPVKNIFADCRALMEKYPFVHRCSIPKRNTTVPSSGLCDEYLVNGKGEVVHKIRTLLDKDQCESLLFTVRHESFKCP